MLNTSSNGQTQQDLNGRVLHNEPASPCKNYLVCCRCSFSINFPKFVYMLHAVSLLSLPQEHDACLLLLPCSSCETNSLVNKWIMKTLFAIHSSAVITLNKAGNIGRQLSTHPSWRHQKKQIFRHETCIIH